VGGRLQVVGCRLQVIGYGLCKILLGNKEKAIRATCEGVLSTVRRRSVVFVAY